MQGFVFKRNALAMIMFYAITLNSFAANNGFIHVNNVVTLNSSAGCMSCHQGDATMTTDEGTSDYKKKRNRKNHSPHHPSQVTFQ